MNTTDILGHTISKVMEIPWIEWVLRHRFTKFATVGLSGTVVNLALLYVGQEILFRNIHPEPTRLNLSLAFAILSATLNNFFWNRVWTWGDRKHQIQKGVLLQLLQYFAACWLAISIQVLLTKVLAHSVHYLVANGVSILIAAFVNYILNDIWTFSVKRARDHRRIGAYPKDTRKDLHAM